MKYKINKCKHYWDKWIVSIESKGIVFEEALDHKPEEDELKEVLCFLKNRKKKFINKCKRKR